MSIYNTVSYTVCPRSSEPIYILSYYMKWVTTSWTVSRGQKNAFDANTYLETDGHRGS